MNCDDGRNVNPVFPVTMFDGKGSPDDGKKFTPIPFVKLTLNDSQFKKPVPKLMSLVCSRKRMPAKLSANSARRTKIKVLPVKEISNGMLTRQSCSLPLWSQIASV